VEIGGEVIEVLLKVSQSHRCIVKIDELKMIQLNRGLVE
jgi:hypothetical protein